MKFGYTIIYVQDVKESLNFYKNAFGFDIKFITPENDYGELISGETTLAFASISLGRSNFSKGFQEVRPEALPLGIELAFVTENIEIDFEKAVEVGATVWEPIMEKPWGQKVGYLRDKQGILIELCSPMKSE